MEDAKSLSDLLVLDYLKENCSDTIVKAYMKGKKLDGTSQKDTSTSLNEVIDTYKSSSSTNTKEDVPAAKSTPIIKSKLVTSTPIITKKPSDSSSSEDSDDEADSDNDDKSKTPQNLQKKKQLTKTRKTPSGKIFSFFWLMTY